MLILPMLSLFLVAACVFVPMFGIALFMVKSAVLKRNNPHRPSRRP